MRLGPVVLAAVMAALTPLHAAAANRADYYQKILGAPSSGDERAFQTVFHQDAQNLSNRMFGRLSSVLGGSAPELRYVNSVDPAGQFHASAVLGQNAINIDPSVTLGLIDDTSNLHSGSVNVLPHEMAHLRQIAQVLASIPDREGGAQAFADLVSPLAAAAAGTSYDQTRNYDGAYADYVKQAQAKGLAWLLGQQFGHAPVSWP